MTQPAEHRAFAFDTEFDDDGGVVTTSSWRPAKRAYTPGEVEALVAQARVEAREQALAEVEGQRAAALATVGQAVHAALPALNQAAEAHRLEASELALAATRIICGMALERFPAGALQAALETLGRELDASPRLVIHLPMLDIDGRAQIERMAADAGFTGAVAFRDDPGLPLAAFRLEWADGRADFDPEAVLGRVTEAVKSTLAAEAGHAETLMDGRR